jgi:metallo-beta-lactamase class B
MRTLLIINLFFAGHVFGQDPAKLKITHLTGDFYIFTTYSDYKGTPFPANGMYVVTKAGVVMFDTPWDSTQFGPLRDSILARHKKNIIMCFATHFHEDRTNGLEYYRRLYVKTYTTRKTDELSRKRGMKTARFLMDKDTTFKVGQYSFQVHYPGHGHSPDNIVIWFEKEKILYGGCLIKSLEDNDLGNLGDASVKDYAETLRNVQRKCRDPLYIIPGHKSWSSNKSLAHSLKMAEKLQNDQ